MLKTNCKKAIENIRAYIVNNFDGTNYEPKFDYIEKAIEDNKHGANIDIFSLVANAIYITFRNEYFKGFPRATEASEGIMFKEWCQGLPSVLDTCYYYNRPAVDDLGDILEETEAERSKYTEDQAAEILTKLIYREIKKAVK